MVGHNIRLDHLLAFVAHDASPALTAQARFGCGGGGWALAKGFRNVSGALFLSRVVAEASLRLQACALVTFVVGDFPRVAAARQLPLR